MKTMTGIKKTVAAILLLLSFTNLFSQVVSGIVYEDSNKNRRKDKNERVLESIPVSNGKEVVLTDKDGRYTLPMGDHGLIFVIKPAGYGFHTDENNLPQYYYIHSIAGSPATYRYKGISPTGALPKSVDFALIPSDESRDFKVLLFGDTQITDSEEGRYLSKAIVSEVEGIKDVAFGITLGDLVNNTLNLHKEYAKIIGEVGIPWHNVIGNHDTNQDAESDELSAETFRANFGSENYAFNYGNAHFIVLDDILLPDPRKKTAYWGGYRSDQLDFIKNELKYVPEDKLIVVAQHIPVFNEGGDAFNLSDRQRLFDCLKRYANVLFLSAHTHYQKQIFYTQEDGWQGVNPAHEYNVGTTCGDWYSGVPDETGVPVSTMRDGTPKGYTFLHINNNTYTLNYKVAGMPENYQMAVFNTKVVPVKRSGRTQIVVNFFMGSPDDKVEYRIDNGEWASMQLVLREDPLYANMIFEWDNSDVLKNGKRPSNPVRCSHIWMSSIPNTPSAGEHRIEIKATDMFGQTFLQQSKYTAK